MVYDRESSYNVENFVEENHDLIVDVLKHSANSYARSCALVLLIKSGTDRDLEAVKRDIEMGELLNNELSER